MAVRGAKAVKGIAIQVAGWILVLLGIAALVLPGPGLLGLFAGMALLSTQYEWAERRLEPVKSAALRTAADSVATVPRIVLSSLGVVGLIAVGVVWGLHPAAPGWWPWDEQWWLPGGWGTGVSLILSGLIAGAMVVYSVLNFRDSGKDRTPEQINR